VPQNEVPTEVVKAYHAEVGNEAVLVPEGAADSGSDGAPGGHGDSGSGGGGGGQRAGTPPPSDKE
jgi:hypothetical protein